LNGFYVDGFAMEIEKIQASKITKPIQLLAAWLISLISVDFVFLYFGSEVSGWERSALVVASIVNVPIFLAAMFVLQTKFRPELQEDQYYEKYLDRKTNKFVEISQIGKISQSIEYLSKEISENKLAQKPKNEYGLSDIIGEIYKIGLNEKIRNYDEIKLFLKSREIKINDIFGKGSNLEIPNKVIMAINFRIGFKIKVEIIKLAHELGIDGYGYFDPPGEATEEDILIGAYGMQKNYVPMTENTLNFIENVSDLSELTEFEKKYIKHTYEDL